MNEQILTYQIPEIPDPAYSQYQAIAGGDIRKAISDGSEHILRTLSHMPSHAVSVELLFVFDPKCTSHDRQTRLNLYLRLWASDRQTLQSLGKLVRGGLLSRFYEFETTKNISLDKKQLSANCDIVRREDFIQPLHNCDFNARIPDRYYTIVPFTANEKNDCLTLDRVLDQAEEQVIISIKLSPADVSGQLYAHTEYLARLQSINRSWDDELCESFSGLDYSAIGKPGYRSFQNKLEPLRYKDPLADDILRQQRRFHESLRQPHLLFNIQVLAKTQATARLVGSVLAESAFEEGGYRLVLSENAAELCGNKIAESEQHISSSSALEDSSQDMNVEGYRDLRPLKQLATVEELLGIFRLPVASFSSPFCIRKNTDPEYIDPKSLIVLGYDEQGSTGNSHPIPRGLHIEVLKKHFSNFGLPGMGKTTSNINILIQLYERGIPFMVIESAKAEYRVLKRFKKHKKAIFRKLAKALEIYTLGNEKVSPFRFNPLQILPGIDVDEHIENLLSCFKASIPVSTGSLPALLGEALERVYEEFPNPDKPPVMSDLIEKVEEVLASKGYSTQTRFDMQTVIEVRLGVLAQRIIGKVFQSRKGIDIGHLMKVPSIIELDRLPCEQGCLSTLSILLSICEKLKASPAPTKGLRYVIVIEEAHNLLGTSQSMASEEVADPKSFIADFISKMLVELRALGVGIILSDQHPSALDSGASKSVGSKLAFRQVYSEDRDELGRSMLFGNIEMQDIARLQPGEAFLFTEGYFGPRRIKTVNLHKQLNLTELPGDAELHEIICQEKWFKDAAELRIIVEFGQLKDHMDKYDNDKAVISNNVEKFLKIRDRLLTKKFNTLRRNGLGTVLTELRTQRSKLASLYEQFYRGPYRRFSCLQNELDCQDELIRKFGESVMGRFEKTIKPHTRELLESIDKSIKECIKLKN